IEASDWEQSVVAFLRKGAEEEPPVLVVSNFTPVRRNNYRVGVPRPGFWHELLNTDSKEYAGSGVGNMGGVDAVPIAWHGQRWSVVLTLPPLATLMLRPEVQE